MALKKIPVSLPEDLIARAKAIADEEDRFLSDVIREALENYLENRDEEEDEEDEETENDTEEDEEEEAEPADDEK